MVLSNLHLRLPLCLHVIKPPDRHSAHLKEAEVWWAEVEANVYKYKAISLYFFLRIDSDRLGYRVSS